MNSTPVRKVNVETAVQIGILLGFACLFFYMAATGKITYYLHPRLIPFIAFAAAAFLLMAFSLVRGLKNPGRRFSPVPYLVFLLPIILAIAVPAGGSDTSLQFSGGISAGLISGIGHTSKSPAASPQAADSSVGNSAGNSTATISDGTGNSGQTQSGPAAALTVTGDTLDINDENFVSWLSELDANPDKYAGKKIQYIGYVYKSGDFRSDEFVLGRNMMWCCAADLELVGCLCQYAKTSELSENSWVEVSGTLSTETYNGEATPLITDITIIPTQKPSQEYVYPSY